MLTKFHGLPDDAILQRHYADALDADLQAGLAVRGDDLVRAEQHRATARMAWAAYHARKAELERPKLVQVTIKADVAPLINSIKELNKKLAK